VATVRVAGSSRELRQDQPAQADGTVASEENHSIGARVRDVRQGPDGYLYVPHRFRQIRQLLRPGAGLCPAALWQTDDRGRCPWRMLEAASSYPGIGDCLAATWKANRRRREQALRLELKGRNQRGDPGSCLCSPPTTASEAPISFRAALPVAHRSRWSCWRVRNMVLAVATTKELASGGDLHPGSISHVLAPRCARPCSNGAGAKWPGFSAGNVRPGLLASGEDARFS